MRTAFDLCILSKILDIAHTTKTQILSTTSYWESLKGKVLILDNTALEVIPHMSNNNLISEDYKSLNEKLHESSEEFGNKNNFLARELPISIAILHKLFNYKSVLDYGCGKGLILDALHKKLLPLGMNLQGYDPCVKKFASRQDRQIYFYALMCWNMWNQKNRMRVEPHQYSNHWRLLPDHWSSTCSKNTCWRKKCHINFKRLDGGWALCLPDLHSAFSASTKLQRI